MTGDLEKNVHKLLDGILERAEKLRAENLRAAKKEDEPYEPGVCSFCGTPLHPDETCWVCRGESDE